MYNLKLFIRQLVFAIFYWIAAFSLFILIRFLAHGEEQGSEYVNPNNIVPVTEWIHYGVILGILIGFLYGVVEFVFEKYITKYLYLGVSVLLKIGIYFVILVFSLSFITRLIELEMDLDLPNGRRWWLDSALFWLSTVYFFIASFIFLFIKIANEKFGKGILFNMLVGKYRKPTEEKRIFMFLDLKSSTTIAEELGHYKYSQLLQDCFFDLNKCIDRYSGEIYQYVGDEAVISWKFQKGIKNSNCLTLYFAFEKALQKRSKYYKRKYGLLPFFKAGVHGGKLIIAEVGSVKKELAFHGDVINSTARIQGECNKYDEALLISNELLEQIHLHSKYKAIHIGELLLRGKQETLDIYAIRN